MTHIILIFFSIAAAINAIASTLLGAIVYMNNKHSLVNKTFALFAFYVALWSYPYIFWPLAQSKEACLFWFRALHIGAILIPVGFYHFVTTFLDKDSKRSVIIAYIFAGIFILFSFSRYYIADMRPISLMPYYGVPGAMYVPFLAMFFGYTGLSLYLLFSEYGRCDAQKKAQILLVGVGTLIGFIGGSNNYLPWFDIPAPPFLNCLVTVYVLMTAYAIVRHKFLDIEVIIKKTLVFAGLFVFVYAVFAGMAFFSQGLFEKILGVSKWMAMIPSVLIVIFALKPIEKFLVNITDKYLFQKKYDYKELLKTFTSEVLMVLDLDKLVDLTVDKLVDIIKLKSCAVVLFDNDKQRFGVRASQNVKDRSIVFLRHDEIIVFLENTHGYLLRPELIEKKIFIPEPVRTAMDQLSAELVIPMLLHEKLIGMLSLGKKKSDEGYTQDDLDILLPLARTLAIAISNAELFEELSKTQAEAAQKEKMAVIGTLAAGMAHEIRNPITTIKIFTEFLKERKEDPRFIEKFERLVPKEVEKINYMITHLLEFSKPADYKTMETVDVQEPLKGVLEILEAEMTLNDIVLKENVGNVSPVYGNKKYIQEILFNIIQNAIHAIGRRGSISVEAEEAGKYVEVRVADTGCGILEEHVQHIFEPFFTTKLDSEGVGLGLYVIRQLMMRMGGSISVKSKAGQGTTFYLSFLKA